MNPFRRAVRPMLFLPDGYLFLDSIHQPLSRFKSISPVSGAEGHNDACLAEFQMPQPMDDRAFDDGPATSCFGFQLSKFSFSHFRITIVVERTCLFFRSKLARGSKEHDDGTRLCRTDLANRSIRIDGVMSYLDH